MLTCPVSEVKLVFDTIYNVSEITSLAAPSHAPPRNPPNANPSRVFAESPPSLMTTIALEVN